MKVRRKRQHGIELCDGVSCVEYFVPRGAGVWSCQILDDLAHTKVKKCREENCLQIFRNHHHGVKEAARFGWFFQRNGDAWCPNHHPEWVAEWRKKQIDARSQGSEGSS